MAVFGAMTDSFDVIISDREEQAQDIVVLELQSAGDRQLPSFDAGAHVDVDIAPGIIRQYSLCNNPAEGESRYRIGVLRELKSRGGSAEIFRSFSKGRIIRISPPRNNFHLIENSRRSILVAGGIGITPLLAMAYYLHDHAQEFEFHYCVRSRNRAAFVEEMATTEFWKKVFLHCDDGLPEQQFNVEKALIPNDHATHLYTCGPTGFIDFVVDGALRMGWRPDRIHVEHFQREVEKKGDGFTVVAARSGVTTHVAPDQTIVAALARVGVVVELSCEQGVCGTCITDVIEGVPDHRDVYLTDAEKASNAKITVCCSRSLTRRLVLDI